MDVIQFSEYFGDENDDVTFQYTQVIFQHDNQIYHGLSKKRYGSKLDINDHDLYDTTQISVEELKPKFENTFTKACDYSKPVKWYIKRQCLSHYDPSYPDRLKYQTLQEVKICEILRANSHPNIAVYHGCEVMGGQITGLCFTKYSQTLMEKVNGAKYNKQSFALKMAGNIPHEANRWLDDIGCGIRHLHSLGLIHNDINPSNIMFDGDIPVIIDFGSCTSEGHNLNSIGRTYEWHDGKIMEAKRSNDLDALEEIRLWLKGDVDSFKY